MQHALDAFLSVAARHPTAALAFIALVAFAESLAIIGTLVPAGIVMFGAGVLVGHGTLHVGWTLALAAAGAVAGDALSYELGRREQDRVRKWAIVQRHAAHISKAEGLVARHGAMSVVIARFTGAVRAFVPLLAGFARMPAGRFYVTNVVSALFWAPAHILPGIVFGASLHMAEQASGRLVVLLLLVAAVVWAATWIARVTIRWLVPFARRVRGHLWRAIATRPTWWARLLRLFLDPDRPDSLALLVAFAVVLGSMWLFLGIVEDVVSRDPLVVADQAVFAFLQQLRTHPVDRLMVGITELGSVGVMLPLILTVAGALAVEGCWQTAGYWVATAASSELLVQVLERTLGRHRPLALHQGAEQFSFPSGHATMSAVVLAYLAFLLSRGQPIRWRLAVGGTAAVYAALVGFSRLYLGAHWMSDVLGGFCFGLAAAALSAMVYTQHRVSEPFSQIRVAVIAAATIMVAGSFWSVLRGPADLQRYLPTATRTAMSLQAWTGGGFRRLPAYRREIAGERNEPFTIQVACPESDILSGLRRAGWGPAAGLTITSVLQAVAPHPAIGGLPVLAKLDGGRASALNLMEVPDANSQSRNVLRLWRSEVDVDGVPLWYGTFYRERQVHPNYSFLRQQAAPSKEFDPVLLTAGMRRLGTGSSGLEAPGELWSCQ